MYRSGSGSFYHQAKIVRKNVYIHCFVTSFWLFIFENEMTKIAGSGSESESGPGSISQRHGSADPDPHQNVMDPQYCFHLSVVLTLNNEYLLGRKMRVIKRVNYLRQVLWAVFLIGPGLDPDSVGSVNPIFADMGFLSRILYSDFSIPDTG